VVVKNWAVTLKVKNTMGKYDEYPLGSDFVLGAVTKSPSMGYFSGSYSAFIVDVVHSEHDAADRVADRHR
jgi:hypothetical protein